jgi:aryl-alcohol dehydrogenase-like predicted oxidoreductase
VAFGASPAPLIRRAIPSSGEKIPVIGLGSSATFRSVAEGEDVEGLRAVLAALIDRGATVFDTAPSYGASEEVAGRFARELGITNKLFWATKVNVAPRGGGAADPAAARAQVEASFRKLGVETMDLIQVHNLGDVPVQLGILKALKSARRVQLHRRHEHEQRAVRRARPHHARRAARFHRRGLCCGQSQRGGNDPAARPRAQDRGDGLRALRAHATLPARRRPGAPAWAADFDAASWAQFFIKYVLGHPAVTVVTPATSQAQHMRDNLEGGAGRLPDEAARRKMAEFVDALPLLSR